MTLVNKEKWGESFEKLKGLPAYDDYHWDIYRMEMLDALGEDESDIIEFVKGLSEDDKSYLSAIDDEIIEKYHSDEINECITNEIINPNNLRQEEYLRNN